MYNVDSIPNEAGSITEVVDLILHYKKHQERTIFTVVGLGKQKLILGHSWLKKHNPEIDWIKGEVNMSRCPSHCCLGYKDEVRQERMVQKAERKKVDVCSVGPTPEIDHDSDLDSGTSDSNDETLSLEEENCILAMGLFPPPSTDIRASSTISQRLEEAYKVNSKVTDPIPNYLKEFTSVFSKKSFDVLPVSGDY